MTNPYALVEISENYYVPICKIYSISRGENGVKIEYSSPMSSYLVSSMPLAMVLENYTKAIHSE